MTTKPAEIELIQLKTTILVLADSLERSGESKDKGGSNIAQEVESKTKRQLAVILRSLVRTAEELELGHDDLDFFEDFLAQYIVDEAESYARRLDFFRRLERLGPGKKEEYLDREPSLLKRIQAAIEAGAAIDHRPQSQTEPTKLDINDDIGDQSQDHLERS